MFELFDIEGNSLYTWKSIKDMVVGDIFRDYSGNFNLVTEKNKMGNALAIKTKSVVI